MSCYRNVLILLTVSNRLVLINSSILLSIFLLNKKRNQHKIKLHLHTTIIFFFSWILWVSSSRHGSRINTDRFPKRPPKAHVSRGVRWDASPGNLLDFNSLTFPFLGFWVIQTGFWPVPFSPDEALELAKFFIYLKYIYYEKSNWF